MPIPPSSYTSEQRGNIRKCMLSLLLRLPDDRTEPSADFPWTVYEHRFNGAGNIKRAYKSFATKQEAIAALPEIIQRSRSFVERYNGRWSYEKVEDGMLYQIYNFSNPVDIMGFSFSIEHIPPV